MKTYTKVVLYMLLLFNFLPAAYVHCAEKVFFHEDFETLEAWEPLFFRGIERQTAYAIQKQGGSNVLAAKSSNSASALVCKRTFNVAEFPILRWRWKVDNVYAKGDYRRKSGDDYPIRVYVLFAFDPETAAFGLKLKYNIIKILYGRYPPHSTLNYIWTNQPDERLPAASPFTDRSIMIPLQYGPRNVGRWVEETVNVMEDYRRFFGTDPPAQAALAVMNDSDNTGENSTSYLHFIEILK